LKYNQTVVTNFLCNLAQHSGLSMRGWFQRNQH
jgi:hypothetical protein